MKRTGKLNVPSVNYVTMSDSVVPSSSLPPVHVYTLLFSLFWLAAGYTDSFPFAFVSAVVLGFASETLARVVPGKKYEELMAKLLGQEVPDRKAMASAAVKQEEASFYDKPLPPVPKTPEEEEKAFVAEEQKTVFEQEQPVFEQQSAAVQEVAFEEQIEKDELQMRAHMQQDDSSSDEEKETNKQDERKESIDSAADDFEWIEEKEVAERLNPFCPHFRALLRRDATSFLG